MPSSTPAPAGWPRRWPRAASARAIPSRSMLANTPPMLEAHYGVPMTGAVLHSINTRLDAGIVAFQLDHADCQGGDLRPRVRARHAGGAGAGEGEAARHRLRRPAVPAGGRAAVRHRLRGASRRRRSGLRVAHAAGRVGGDRAQLHLGHDRQPEGRRLSPPRRAPDVLRQYGGGRHGQASRLSLDAADVPLQRLVLSLDAVGGRRHARVPPVGACRADVRRPSPSTR